MVNKNLLQDIHKTIIKKKSQKRNPLIPLMNEGLGELRCRRHFLVSKIVIEVCSTQAGAAFLCQGGFEVNKQITTITAKNNHIDKKLKVAAYCCVSTEHEEQRQSLKSQVAYYTQKICNNPDWNFAGIYAEQESGTRVDNREEIQRLMNDCRKGKVDLILMKSLSRFGRNTLDVLLMLDELSKLNVVVYFETENIWSNDPRVKKYITMAAAAYQEESRQKSEAIKWGIRQSSHHGHIKLNHSQFLGYGRDDNGNSRNILKITVSRLSLARSNGVHQPLTEFYPTKNILAAMLLQKLILQISSQVNKKKTKDRLIRLSLRILTKRLLAKRCLRQYRI